MNYLIIDPKQINNGEYKLTDKEQVHHVLEVLKANVGDTMKVAVLGGNLGLATIADIVIKDTTHIYLNHLVADTPPPAKLPVTLVLCLPRPKALRRIMMDAVAMGVKEIYLINSYRVEKSYWQSPHLQRIDEYMKLGLVQAGDTVLPTIHLKKRFKPFVEDDLPSIIQNKHALVAHPYAQQTYKDYCQETRNKLLDTVFVVGAEGGFIPYELDLMAGQGCQSIAISSRILRTETAVSMLLGQVAFQHS